MKSSIKKKTYREVSIVWYMVVTSISVCSYKYARVIHYVSPKYYQSWKENNSDNVIHLCINIGLAKNFYP